MQTIDIIIQNKPLLLSGEEIRERQGIVFARMYYTLNPTEEIYFIQFGYIFQLNGSRCWTKDMGVGSQYSFEEIKPLFDINVTK